MREATHERVPVSTRYMPATKNQVSKTRNVSATTAPARMVRS
jgi:hypothetical protein